MKPACCRDCEDEEMRLLAEAEIAELEPPGGQLEAEIKSMLVPKDPRDERNVIVEIRAGTGGDEAALFAADLFRMYTRYAERRSWHVEVLSANEIGIGGYKEIIFDGQGQGRLLALEVRVGRAPGAARPGHRIVRAHPHLHRHRGGAGRGG